MGVYPQEIDIRILNRDGNSLSSGITNGSIVLKQYVPFISSFVERYNADLGSGLTSHDESVRDETFKKIYDDFSTEWSKFANGKIGIAMDRIINSDKDTLFGQTAKNLATVEFNEYISNLQICYFAIQGYNLLP